MATKKSGEKNSTVFWGLMATIVIPVVLVATAFLSDLLGTAGIVLGVIVGGAVGFGIFMVLGAILSGILPDRIFCEYTGAASTDGGDPRHQFERAFTQNEMLR